MGTGCSRGTRPCLQGLVCYTFCDLRHGKGCCSAFGGISYRAAGSGRDRPAHRQRPAAVRKRPGRNLRAVISEKILFRPGRRTVYKIPRPRRSGQTHFSKNCRSDRNRSDCFGHQYSTTITGFLHHFLPRASARSSASENKYQYRLIMEPH